MRQRLEQRKAPAAEVRSCICSTRCAHLCEVSAVSAVDAVLLQPTGGKWANIHEGQWNNDKHSQPQSAPASTSSDKWLYMDLSGTQQGPFSTSEINNWYLGGYMGADQKVKPEGADGDFVPLGTVPELCKAAAPTVTCRPHSPWAPRGGGAHSLHHLTLCALQMPAPPVAQPNRCATHAAVWFEE